MEALYDRMIEERLCHVREQYLPTVAGEEDELGETVVRKTIMQMRQSNLLIQFPQDEYKPVAAKNNRMSTRKASDLVIKRPQQLL